MENPESEFMEKAVNIKDLFIPSWKRSDPLVRLKAVQTGALNPDILEEIILNKEETLEIKKAAVLRLKDENRSEKLFQNVYGDDSQDLRKQLLKNIMDEQRIRSLYFKMRKEGGKSFLEVPLELRLFEIWEDQVAQTDDSGLLLEIAQKARTYTMGSYVSCQVYTVVEKAIAKITDFHKLTEWFLKEFKTTKELHYSIRDGLYELSKKTQPDFIFAHINDLDYLGYSFMRGEKEWALAAERRIFKLGKKIMIEEKKIRRKCSSCNGSGGGDVRVPYTDRDWEWEKCESCKGTGVETVTKKEFRFENAE